MTDWIFFNKYKETHRTDIQSFEELPAVSNGPIMVNEPLEMKEFVKKVKALYLPHKEIEEFICFSPCSNLSFE